MTYTIGQIEELTGVKAHILRYWEEVIPGFAPHKDMGGRRFYSQRELELVFRIKYLINEKKKGKACVGCPYSGGCTKASCESLDGVKIKVNE